MGQFLTLDQLDAISKRADISNTTRSEIQAEFKLDLQEHLYSQAELVSCFKFTDKPLQARALKAVMDKMEARGYQFSKTQSNHYKLTRQMCFDIANEVGVTRYRDNNKKAFVALIQNLKGGVGKSLGTNLIADAITRLNRYLLKQFRILIVDLDPQGTTTMHHLPNYAGTGMTGLMAMSDKSITKNALFKYAVHKTSNELIDVIPATISDGFLTDAIYDQAIAGDLNPSELLLKRIIENAEDDYDFIFIDCGPHMDAALKNAMRAANGIFIPTPTDIYNWDSTVKFIDRISSVYHKMPNDPNSKLESCHRLKFLASYISKVASNKQAHDKDIFENAEMELEFILGRENTITQPLPEEDAYERCSELSSTIFKIQRNDYPGSKDAYNRAFASAESWSKEVIQFMIYHHSEI